MRIQLIASCTGRKRAQVPSPLRVRSVREGKDRASAWLRQLDRHTAPTTLARDLYGGEHWQLVLGLESDLLKADRDVQLWVASAGYGLVSADTPLKAYSATFASGEADGIPAESAVAWWGTLCLGHPDAKSLDQIAMETDTMIVVASAKYLRAMLPDLLRAREALADPERLIVFSGSLVQELAESQVLVDGRVQVALRHETHRTLRGTKQGLAARTARHLLSQVWPPSASALQNAYDRLVSDVPPPKLPERERHSDDDVRVFIEGRLADDPEIGWTTLLRAWRASGRACEQKRFSGLYRAAQAERGKSKP